MNLCLYFRKLLFKKQWILLFSNNGLCRHDSYLKIHPPKNKFWADPFLIKYDNKYFVFFEEFLLKSKKAHISVAQISSDGSLSDPRIILSRPYHLSYPFVFEYAGDYYLIPEASDSGKIQLFKCRIFPYEWYHYLDLIDNIKAYDTTLLNHNGMWWMFTTIKSNISNSSWDNLHLYYSDSLFSTCWKPHPMNPVVINSANSRSAGSVYVVNNNIIRPSQDCSKIYGYGINFNKIVKMSTTNYEEILIDRIVPSCNDAFLAMHTVNFCDNVFVLDAQIEVTRF